MGRFFRITLAFPLLLAAGVCVMISAAGRGTEAPSYAPDWRIDAALLAPGAQVARGMALLEAGDTARAGAAARAALTLSPLDDRALELLVRVRDKEERWAEEKRLLALSNRLTKRNLPLRYMAMKMAEQDGNHARAARDADLLLRQNAYQDEVMAFLRDLASSAEGQAAIVRRLVARPRWRAAFLGGRDLEAGGYDHAVDLARLLGTTAAPAEPDEIAPLGRALVAAKAFEAAARLRRIAAPDARGHWLVDQHFSRADDAAGGLFGWRLPGQGSFVSDAGVPLGLLGSGIVAEQITFLRPGRYVLRSSVDGISPESLAGLQWSATCIDGGDDPVLDRVVVQQRGSIRHLVQSLSVPAGCSAQRVTLYFTRSDGRGVAGRLRTVSIATSFFV